MDDEAIRPDAGSQTAGADVEAMLRGREVGLSRRQFVGYMSVGSAGVVGMAWASPKVSTIQFGRRVAVGSPPPGTTTTTTTIPGSHGKIAISDHSPCLGDQIRVKASGFAPRTAVAFEIDSAAHPIGNTTASSSGDLNVLLKLPTTGPTGHHRLVAVGVQPGGRTLALSAPVNIKTQAECEVQNEGTTTTIPQQHEGSTTTIPPNNPGNNGGGPRVSHGGGGLAFTGTDSLDLAVIGLTAAVAGRALYGAAKRDREEDEEE